MTVELKEFRLSRSRMTEFLDDLESRQKAGAVSAYLNPGLSEKDMQGLPLPSLPDEIIKNAAGSATGAAVFRGEETNYLVLPPFPLKEKAVFDGFETEPLREIITSEYTVGLVLLHLGSYAVGVCKGEKLLSSKVGTGLVHGRTRKGGSSSARFARRRENQANEFIDRVCGHAREHLEPMRKELEYLVYGGPRQTVLQLRKRCAFLQSFDDRTLPVIDVPQLRQRVLESTGHRLRDSRIIEWSETEKI